MKKSIIFVVMVAILLVAAACSKTKEQAPSGQQVQQPEQETQAQEAQQTQETQPVQAEDTSDALVGEAYSNYVSKISPKDTLVADELNNNDFSEDDTDSLDEEPELPADDAEP